MKTELDCIPCLFKQGLNTVRQVTTDTSVQREILDRIGAEITRLDLNLSPAAVSKRVYELVAEVTGVTDPYRSAKKHCNREALHLLPELELLVRQSSNPLAAALHVAVAGNIIDLGIGHDFDLASDVRTLVHTPMAIDDSELFETELRPGLKLLYLGDNAGEIVFDRVLVQQLLKRDVAVTFCVKSAPIINDATMEDAQEAGITGLVPTIATGSADIGINLARASGQFHQVLAEADVVIAKGHGHFETCIDFPYNIYFLLKAKCDVVSRALGVRTGDIVFKHKPEGGEPWRAS